MQGNLFYIFSIYTIAYLKSIGFVEVKKEKSPQSGKVAYFFENTEELQKALEDYNNDWKLQRFIHAYKVVKDEMFNT